MSQWNHSADFKLWTSRWIQWPKGLVTLCSGLLHRGLSWHALKICSYWIYPPANLIIGAPVIKHSDWTSEVPWRRQQKSWTCPSSRSTSERWSSASCKKMRNSANERKSASGSCSLFVLFTLRLYNTYINGKNDWQYFCSTESIKEHWPGSWLVLYLFPSPLSLLNHLLF